MSLKYDSHVGLDVLIELDQNTIARMSVHALAKSDAHRFSKVSVPELTLVAGLGVEGDCHSGELVQHLSRVKIVPRPPNLRQVHLIPLETLRAVDVQPGQIGENVTTAGVALLELGRDTKLHFLPAASAAESDLDLADQETRPHAVVVVRGVRNPCPQIDKFRPGLKEQFLRRDEERKIIGRSAGVMGTVEHGGPVSLGMRIVVEPPEVHQQLECV